MVQTENERQREIEREYACVFTKEKTSQGAKRDREIEREIVYVCVFVYLAMVQHIIFPLLYIYTID